MHDCNAGARTWERMAGCCSSGAVQVADDSRPLTRQNDDIKKHLDEAEDSEKGVMKLLLLGAGESGKSTLFKQMKVINKDGYSDDERRGFQSIVWSNTIVAMRSLLAAFDKLQVAMPAEVAEAAEKMEEGTTEREVLTPELGTLIHGVWTNEEVQALYRRRNEYQLNDSADYYFDAIQRIADPNYLPTTDDVLRSRVRTTGIVQSDFKIHTTTFSMFDVGGQRNERRKWIHCFDHVNAVCFVAAISEFDQVLYEDDSQNRLDEAVDLFKQVSNSKWFRNTSIILFLNKKARSPSYTPPCTPPRRCHPRFSRRRARTTYTRRAFTHCRGAPRVCPQVSFSVCTCL